MVQVVVYVIEQAAHAGEVACFISCGLTDSRYVLVQGRLPATLSESHCRPLRRRLPCFRLQYTIVFPICQGELSCCRSNISIPVNEVHNNASVLTQMLNVITNIFLSSHIHCNNHKTKATK